MPDMLPDDLSLDKHHSFGGTFLPPKKQPHKKRKHAILTGMALSNNTIC